MQASRVDGLGSPTLLQRSYREEADRAEYKLPMWMDSAPLHFSGEATEEKQTEWNTSFPCGWTRLPFTVPQKLQRRSRQGRIQAGSERTMKLTVLLLTIGLLAGTLDIYLLSNKSRTHIQVHFKTSFYICDLNPFTNISVLIFCSGLIKETMQELSNYADDLKSKVGPMAQDAQQRFTDEISALADKLKSDMEDTKSRAILYSGDLRSMFDQNIEDVQGKVSMYMKKLKKRLAKDGEDLKSKLSQYGEDLSKNTQEKVDNIRKTIEPYVSNLKKKGQARLQSLKDAMDEQGKQLRDRFASVAKDVQSKVKKMTSDAKSSIDKLSEQMRKWFNPSIDNLRNELQNLAKSLQNKKQ
ncbi:apolipoprotein E [Mixophyes fleayi]|uniref:apolipoprotein E n=1 Tax=Mixophyes fleayi TaxID=3061075 RepID=UPI003F4D74FA